MILVPDTYKTREETIKNIKYVTIDKNNNIRLDRIDLKYENGSKILERMSHFGKYFGKFFSIDDFSYSKTDVDKNVVESVESSITNGFDSTKYIPYPTNYIGIDGKRADFGFINKAVYDITELQGYNIRHASLNDNVCLPVDAYGFEDLFNLEFSNLVGNISTLITRTSLSIPFRMDIVIDSRYGINITNLNEIFKDSEFKTVLRNELLSFTKALNVIERSLKKICEEEKRSIRLYVGIREFDSYIKIKDIDYNLTYDLHLNNTDHARSIYTTISHLGSRWFDTEQFGDLMETKCITVPAVMYELTDELRRNNFEMNDYSDNFLLRYF